MPGVEIKKVKAEDDGMRLNRWFMKYYPDAGAAAKTVADEANQS